MAYDIFKGKIVIPMKTINRLILQWEKSIGFDERMFWDEFDAIFMLYDLESCGEPVNFGNFTSTLFCYEAGIEQKLTEEAKATYCQEAISTYLSLPIDRTFVPTNDFIQDAMNVGKNLIIPFPWKNGNPIFVQEKFDLFWNKYIKEEEPSKDVYYELLALTALYYKYKMSSGFYDLSFQSNAIPTSQDVRKDLLQLYVLFHDTFTAKNKRVEIGYNNEKITLKNADEWFTKLLDAHFKQYLTIPNVEHAKMELEKFDPNYSKSKGRKSDKGYDSLLIGIYNITKRTPLASDKSLNNEEAMFILDYLKLVDAIEEEGVKDDIQHLRASIKNIKDKSIQWWNPAITNSWNS